MPENKNVTGTVAETAPGLNGMKLSLDDLVFKITPFTYAGKEYTELDLRGIKDLNTKQLERVEDVLMEEGKTTQAMWTTIRGATLLAAAANDMPFDWLDNAKAKDVLEVRNGVFAFFIGLV